MLEDLIDELVDTISDLYWTDERKGKYGEKLTERKLKLVNVFGRKGKILKNVYIPKENGETSEIDLVYITEKGIFVLESKNYSGWIFGDFKSQYWTASLPNGDKNKFYNPIKQNWGHIYSLSAFFQLDKWIFKSIIVFSNAAKLKIDTETPVINMSRLKRQILSYRQQIMSTDDVALIYDKIIKTNLVGAENEKRHINAVRNKVAEQQTALRNGKCPKCGNDLVLRDGKYGQFYGCANYPRCKFTQKID